MADHSAWLNQARILPFLIDCLVPGDDCYLVGGALRDFLLKRPVNDFDFATPGDPTSLARRFANAIGGTWFMLDATRRQSRVLLENGQHSITYDFTPFRAESLHADLHLRDFTVNALALNLRIPKEPMEDPLAAQADLSRGILRACSPTVFQDDPLRVLRGVRLAASLAMSIEARSRIFMQDAVSALNRVAAERITHELDLILSVDDPVSALTQLESLELFPVIFSLPESDVCYAQGVHRVQQLTEGLSLCPHNWLATISVDVFSALAILRLAAFMTGSRLFEYHPLCLKRLRFSKKTTALIGNLINLTPVLADALTDNPIRGRGRALLVASLGPDPQLSLIYLLCLATYPLKFQAWMQEARSDYLAHVRHGQVPDLVSGSWVRQVLHLEAGPVIGCYLRLLRREEIAGRVQTLNDAHKFLKSLTIKNIDKTQDPP